MPTAAERHRSRGCWSSRGQLCLRHFTTAKPRLEHAHCPVHRLGGGQCLYLGTSADSVVEAASIDEFPWALSRFVQRIRPATQSGQCGRGVPRWPRGHENVRCLYRRWTAEDGLKDEFRWDEHTRIFKKGIEKRWQVRGNLAVLDKHLVLWTSIPPFSINHQSKFISIGISCVRLIGVHLWPYRQNSWEWYPSTTPSNHIGNIEFKNWRYSACITYCCIWWVRNCENEDDRFRSVLVITRHETVEVISLYAWPAVRDFCYTVKFGYKRHLGTKRFCPLYPIFPYKRRNLHRF